MTSQKKDKKTKVEENAPTQEEVEFYFKSRGSMMANRLKLMQQHQAKYQKIKERMGQLLNNIALAEYMRPPPSFPQQLQVNEKLIARLWKIIQRLIDAVEQIVKDVSKCMAEVQAAKQDAQQYVRTLNNIPECFVQLQDPLSRCEQISKQIYRWHQQTETFTPKKPV